MREQFDIKMHLSTCMFTCMCTCVKIQQMKTKSAVNSIMSVIWLNSNLHFCNMTACVVKNRIRFSGICEKHFFFIFYKY